MATIIKKPNQHFDATTYTGTGSAATLDFSIPWDHKLNIITIAKEGSDSDNIEVRYIPTKVRDSDYDILYSNSAVTAKSIIIELGDKYDIKDFHHEILKRGSVPLDILEGYINDWISETLDS